MGHTRLGSIPTSQKWSSVVRTLQNALMERPLTDTAMAQIASETLSAAQGALQNARHDPGLAYAFFLLARLSLSARSPDWPKEFRALGVDLKTKSTLVDLTSELQRSVDAHLSRRGLRTDISEIAQRALGDALRSSLSAVPTSLFQTPDVDLKNAIHSTSTKTGFANLGHSFFASFLARFLNFYLSRITASSLGLGGLSQLGDVSTFNDLLYRHCRQSASIVRDFCGEWYSKTEFQKGIDETNAASFVAVALNKLQAEMDRQHKST